MNAQIKNKIKGFTIIEVVLVLAIAGLILLMVLVAWPALQRSQRDQARKNDAQVVASAVSSYISNNRGDFPEANDLSGYLDDLSENTDKDKITVDTSDRDSIPATHTSVADSAIVIVVGKKCGASTNTSQAFLDGSSRQFSVVTKLESGNGQLFCQTS